MELINGSVAGFTQLLASPAPAPGGGGAAALVGAVAVALGDMVGELTVGKKKYAAVEEEMKGLMEKAQRLRVSLLGCVQKDAEAFEPLSRAYGIPKDDPARDEVMEKCLREAAAAPLEILDLCCEAVGLLKEFAEKGSRLAVSDAATGAVFCQSAIRGAAINVKVNTRLMKDRGYAAKINSHVDRQLAKYLPEAGKIYDDIYASFG